MSQNKGDFLVKFDGTVIPDDRDHTAESNAWFADERNPRSFNVFTTLKDDTIQFAGCLWEIEGGIVKACLTDREYNMIEIAGITLEQAADIFRNALAQAK